MVKSCVSYAVILFRCESLFGLMLLLQQDFEGQKLAETLATVLLSIVGVGTPVNLTLGRSTLYGSIARQRADYGIK